MAVTNTIIGNLHFNLKGEYDASVGYIIDDVVTYRNADYVCIQATSPGTVPSTTANWKLFRDSFKYMGDFENTNGKQYYRGDIVKTQVPIDNQNANFDQDITATAYYVAKEDLTVDHTGGTINGNPWWNAGGSHATNNKWEKIGASEDFTDETLSNFKATTQDDQTAVVTGQENECIWLPNFRGGMMNDNSLHYRLGDNYQMSQMVDHLSFIDGNGAAKHWGSNNGSGSPHNTGNIFVASSATFHHYDWWRSTDNGGTGVHTTPDGKIPKVIQIVQGYNTIMWLMNSGECYHAGYGGNGQSGDASNSNRSYTTRCGGSLQNVYLATNTSVHTLRDVRIKRVFISNNGGYDNNEHSCYALDENGGLWSWGYNGYGQLGHGDTSSRNQPTLISQSSFGNHPIVAFWTGGTQYAMCFALNDQDELFVWGYNGYGQLGLGNTSNQTSPQQITATAFTDAGAGKIIKMQTAEYGSYSCAALLTDKGDIYTTGYNSYSWNMSGNSNQQNAWTKAANGPGSQGEATNIWFTGNGQYQTFWVYDGANDKLLCIGNNNNYQLGIGNATNQTSLQTPQVSIHGSTTDIKNVKEVLGCSQSNTHNTFVLTTDGNVFVTGQNSYGCTGFGYSSTYVNDQNWNNGIEVNGDGYFQLPSLPSTLIGQVDQIMPTGYSTSVYWGCLWKSYDRRLFYSGYAASGMTHHFGDYRNSGSGNYANRTPEPVVIG